MKIKSIYRIEFKYSYLEYKKVNYLDLIYMFEEDYNENNVQEFIEYYLDNTDKSKIFRSIMNVVKVNNFIMGVK